MGTIIRQLLMKKNKDELDRVWVAAHFPKRIKKELVDETNIGSSVDKILLEKLAVKTYRILGYYLLGVVRIYSKKVEYLLVDCNHSLNEMKFFSEGRKKVDINYGGTCLPESSTQRSQLKVVDVSSSESSRRKNSYTFVESMRAQFSSVSLPDNFDLDAYDLEIVEDDSSNESDEELVHDSVPLTEQEQHRQEPEWDNNYTDSTDMMHEGVQNPDKQPAEECTTTGQTLVSEMTSVDNIMLKPSPKKSQLSVAIDITPQSKAPVVSGERKSELVAVRTPASRERVRAPRKRKCVYDYAVVVPNKVYTTWVSDASDLVRKRQTCTDVVGRKEHRSFDYFKQSQIPINAGSMREPRSVMTTNEQAIVEVVEETVGPTPLNVLKLSGATEAEVIAPQTPVAQTTPLMFNDVHETSMVNQVRPTCSSESVEKAMFPIIDSDVAEIRSDEGPSSLGEDNQENVAEKLSAVTKSVGGYLHSNFVRRTEKGEEEAVKLSQLLKKKTKKESAMFFYQILVLKTGGYIDVKQEKPYDEIFVKQTQKLKEVFGGGSRE